MSHSKSPANESEPSSFTPELAEILSGDAPPDEKDRLWYTHVYQGNRMPQLTLRAVIMGGVLGMLMAASNLYTTLSIGWAFGVAITACVMSYVIWSIIRIFSGRRIELLIFAAGMLLLGVVLVWKNILPAWGGLAVGGVGVGAALWLRRKLPKMSILENNCMQSTASAAGYSTGSTLATMFGSMLLLAEPLEGAGPESVKTWEIQPVWVVVIFTLCTGLMGVFLAVPLKRQMINHEQLRFPSGVAAAATLRSLYSESAAAMRKAYVLLWGLGAGLIVGILNTGEGTLEHLDRFFDRLKGVIGFSPRIPESMPESGFFNCNGGKLVGFGLDRAQDGSLAWLTALPRTPGVGMAAFNYEPSALLIGAGMITGMRVCLSMLVGSVLLYFFVGPYLVGIDTAAVGSGWSLVEGSWVYSAAAASPDYKINIPLNGSGTVLRLTVWSLWGGTAVMVFASLTAVALQWKTIARAFGSLRKGKNASSRTSELDAVEVPISWMIAGMVPISIAMLAVQMIAFHISWWAGLIAIGMSFFLALVACRATGETDTTPIGAMGKVMQLIFAVIAPGNIQANLASAGIAANSASSSADLLTDLKSGYLLGASPRKQFLAQFTGVFFGTLAIVPIWYLMVPNKAKLDAFAAPATRQWEAVARILVKGVSELPQSAIVAILLGALVGVALPIVDKFSPKRLRPYLPSAMGLGLSWVIPFSSAMGFFTGACVLMAWERLNRKNSDGFAIPLASGLIAGESLIKALIAMAATALGLFASGG